MRVTRRSRQRSSPTSIIQRQGLAVVSTSPATTSRKLLNLLQIVFMVATYSSVSVSGFMITSLGQIQGRVGGDGDFASVSNLCMAPKKKNVGGGGGGTKKKVKKGGNSFGGAGGGGKTKTKTKRNTNQKQQQQQQQQSKKKKSNPPHGGATAGGGGGGGGVTPPWQIVSKKDMAKNIKAETKRRELAQQGMHLTPDEIETTKDSYTISRSFLDPADKSFLAWKRFSNFVASSPSSSSSASGGNKQQSHKNTNQNQDEIKFIGAYLDKRLPPRLGVPEIAFLGRSNVGKSSLLNKLVGTKESIARVGKTPGATASVNLYTMNRKSKPILGLVDLPGFGYAKLSKENKESVQLTAEHYLEKRKELVLGILLVDIRRTKPSDDDKAVLAALFDMGIPIVVVATKADKLSTQTKIDTALESIRNELGLPDGQPLCVSSVTGMGIKDLWKITMEACEIGVEEYKNSLQRGGGDDEQPPQQQSSDDEEDISYSQGFDWIHGSYYDDDEGEHDEGFEYENDNDIEDYDYYGDDDEYEDAGEGGPNQNESIKFLRKKAKDMERSGEV